MKVIRCKKDDGRLPFSKGRTFEVLYETPLSYEVMFMGEERWYKKEFFEVIDDNEFKPFYIYYNGQGKLNPQGYPNACQISNGSYLVQSESLYHYNIDINGYSYQLPKQYCVKSTSYSPNDNTPEIPFEINLNSNNVEILQNIILKSNTECYELKLKVDNTVLIFSININKITNKWGVSVNGNKVENIINRYKNSKIDNYIALLSTMKIIANFVKTKLNENRS